MKHCMIDLETLDTRPSTVILSIGAVVFDPDEPLADLPSLYYNLCIQDQLGANRTISEDTIMWWLMQGEEARVAVTNRSTAVGIHVAVKKFSELYHGNKCERVWSNGLAFDIAALEHAYTSYGWPVPWKYNHAREMRNLRDLCPDLEGTGEVAHHALHDAIRQATFVHAALRRLRSEQDRIAGLEATLDQAAQWFEDYEREHLNKGAVEKAKRNGDRAKACRQMIAP